MKINKFGFCLVLITAIVIPAKLNSAISYSCCRRVKIVNPEFQLNRTISMISQMEKGTFPLHSFTSDDVVYAVLDFLKQPNIQWKMKERLLQWMPDFFTILSPGQQQTIREEFKNLDEARYQNLSAQVLNSLSYPAISLIPSVPLLSGAEPFVANIGMTSAIEMAALSEIDRRAFSKYLP